jgi:hypothetical protein
MTENCLPFCHLDYYFKLACVRAFARSCSVRSCAGWQSDELVGQILSVVVLSTCLPCLLSAHIAEHVSRYNSGAEK